METTLSEALDMSPDNEDEDDEDNDNNDDNQERDRDREGLEGGAGGGGGEGGHLHAYRRALKSLRQCRQEHANSFSRACALLLRRDWADTAHAPNGVAAVDISGNTVVKKHFRYSTRDVGAFVRLHISWAPTALTLLQVITTLYTHHLLPPFSLSFLHIFNHPPPPLPPLRPSALPFLSSCYHSNRT